VNVDPLSIPRCDKCDSKADVCIECKICLRCFDEHDEGCSNQDFTPRLRTRGEHVVKTSRHRRVPRADVGSWVLLGVAAAMCLITLGILWWVFL
jgi:hypothetical protein